MKNLHVRASSAGKRNKVTGAVKTLLANVKAALADIERKQWQIGKWLVELIDHHHWSLSDIAQHVEYKPPYLSQMYNAVKKIPKPVEGLNFPQHNYARVAAERMASSLTKYTPTEHAPDYERAVKVA